MRPSHGQRARIRQRLGDRCTVDGDERLALPNAEVMQCPRGQFFASTAFALDQNTTVTIRKVLNRIANTLHGFALADQTV